MKDNLPACEISRINLQNYRNITEQKIQLSVPFFTISWYICFIILISGGCMAKKSTRLEELHNTFYENGISPETIMQNNRLIKEIKKHADAVLGNTDE